MTNLYAQQESNVRKTWLLITAFLALIIALGWIFSYALRAPQVLYFAVGFSFLMNFVAYWKSYVIALAMSRARPIDRAGNEYLYRIIENLCITAGLPQPRVYMIDSNQINAFATGRDAKHAAIAVTSGALQKLQKDELEGVLAHELSHVGNRDILVSTIVVVLAGMISVMADMFLRMSFWGGLGGRNREEGEGGAIVMAIGLVAALLAPLAAMLMQLSVSRKREFLADASGALLTRYPEGLASALEKIKLDQAPMKTAYNATAHLFITNPFKGKDGAGWLAKLFMTHPPLDERINILRSMDVSK